MTDVLSSGRCLGYLSDEATFALLVIAFSSLIAIRCLGLVKLARSHRDVPGMVTGTIKAATAAAVGVSTVLVPGAWLGLYTQVLRIYAGG